MVKAKGDLRVTLWEHQREWDRWTPPWPEQRDTGRRKATTFKESNGNVFTQSIETFDFIEGNTESRIFSGGNSWPTLRSPNTKDPENHVGGVREAGRKMLSLNLPNTRPNSATNVTHRTRSHLTSLGETVFLWETVFVGFGKAPWETQTWPLRSKTGHLFVGARYRHPQGFWKFFCFLSLPQIIEFLCEDSRRSYAEHLTEN